MCEDMLVIARKYRQSYITVWYPHKFGEVKFGDNNDMRRYTNIVQQTLPTRTGLNELKSTAVVWMSLST